jgi:hypothetical protein
MVETVGRRKAAARSIAWQPRQRRWHIGNNFM